MNPAVSPRVRSAIAAILVVGICCTVAAPVATAQLERQRANPGGPVGELFWAPTLITTSTVTNLNGGDLNFSIIHVFGIATRGVEDLFGLDAAANIRFGLDYGVTDRLSLGFGRSRFERIFDYRFKLNVLRQTRDNRIPVEVAVKGDAAIRTDRSGFDFVDRLSYLGTVMVARRFGDRVSVQVSPMYSHLNTVYVESDREGNVIDRENGHFGVAIAARVVLSTRLALTAEYIPVFGPRSDDTVDAVGVGLDIETGGHVFQLFVTTSQWLTEQHVMARNTDNFFDGDFRFGFNVNRVFGLGGYE